MIVILVIAQFRVSGKAGHDTDSDADTNTDTETSALTLMERVRHISMHGVMRGGLSESVKYIPQERKLRAALNLCIN